MYPLITAFLILLTILVPTRAAESPFTGKWKVVALPPGAEVTLWLVQLTEKDGRLQAELAGPQGSGTTIGSVEADDKALHLALKSPFLAYKLSVYPSKSSTTGAPLLGSLEARGRRDMVRLERSDLKELPGSGIVAPTAAAEPLQQAESIRDAKEREAAFRSLLTKFAGQPVAFHAALELVALGVESGAADGELRTRADMALKLAANYGPEMEMQAAMRVARQLARGEKQAALALDYARKAQRLLAEDDSAAVRVRVGRTLALALRRSGQPLAARPLEMLADPLDAALDAECQQATPPFECVPFTGRKTLSDRIVALELFTSSSCPYCVAADLACAGVAKSFGAKDVAILAYHLPIPTPDPLANHDAEKRAAYYNVQSTSALLINGKAGPIVGGSIVEARDRYDDLRKALLPQLEMLSPVQLRVSAIRRGDKIDIQTEAAELPKSETLRLRLAVVEEKVRYPGPNGQRLHFHVVRALLGGVEGIPLRTKTARQNMTISLQGLTKSLQDYLNEFDRVQKFLDDERPLELRRLRIVALVQDDKTKEILQAAFAEAPDK
jgi:thiol-disulfide isomerase/thioredoxin